MKKLIALLLALTLVFTLVGCATDDGGTTTPDTPSGGDTQQGGDTQTPSGGDAKILKYAGVYPDMQILDVMKSTTTDTGQAGHMVVEPLMGVNPDYSIYPLLLESTPTVSDDGTVFTCKLKQGVKFHDGTELKASDVEFTFNRMFKPETVCVNTFLCDMILGGKEMLNGEADHLEGFKVLSDYEFTITLETPYSPFLSVLSCEQMSIYPEKACTEAGDRWGIDTFVGTGPYKLKSFTPKEVLRVEKFDEYHGEPVSLDGIEMYNMDQNTALLEYESGNLDAVMVNQDVVQNYKDDPAFENQLVETPLIGIISMNLNVNKAPLDNPKVREAIGYAVDQESLVNNYLQGNAQATGCFLPNGCPGHDDARPASKYDPEKAKQLLADAGFPDGIKIVSTVSEKSTVVGIATVLQEQMKAAGIEMEIQKVDDAAYIDLRKQGEVQVPFLTWYADIVDPDNFIYTVFYSSNSKFFSSCYQDADVDAKLDEGRALSDPDARIKLYVDLENKLVNEDFVTVPLYNPSKFYLIKENVKGITFRNSIVEMFYATKD